MLILLVISMCIVIGCGLIAIGSVFSLLLTWYRDKVLQRKAAKLLLGSLFFGMIGFGTCYGSFMSWYL